MGGFLKRLKSDCCGVIMLEALIVFFITLFLLFFVLAAFSTLFQRFNIQIIANETVARLAQTYGYSIYADTLTGEIDLDAVVESDPYRYWNEKKLKSKTEEKAKEYATGRLKKTTFTKEKGEPAIKATVTPDALGRRHITIEITGGFYVPFGEALEYFGFNPLNEYKVYAYADGIDLLNYINTVDIISNYSKLDFLDSKLIKMVNSILKLFKNLGF